MRGLFAFKYLSAAALVALSAAGSALAADMQTPVYKASRSMPAAYNWTGFYVGAQGGYGWGRTTSNVTTLPTPLAFFEDPFSLDVNARGFLGGLQAGYNWQFNRAIFGIETDFAYAQIKDESTRSPLTAFGFTFPGTYQTNSQQMDWFGTLRARAGFLASDNLLVFATGGLAFGRVNYSNFQFLSPAFGNQFSGSITEWKTGWTVGGGAEWALWRNWSVKCEYLYYDLGTETVTANRVPFIAGVDQFKVVSSFETKGHIARIGLNYKFD